MTMNEEVMIPEKDAVELTNKLPDTLKRWRHGKYFRRNVGRIYYFSDKRKLRAKKIAGVWHYDRRDLEFWNSAINERTGVWRRSE